MHQGSHATSIMLQIERERVKFADASRPPYNELHSPITI
jgi:hypothetical protein